MLCATRAMWASSLPHCLGGPEQDMLLHEHGGRRIHGCVKGEQGVNKYVPELSQATVCHSL